MAVTQAKDKYYLRSLHEEIGLYDRKLAHLLKYDTFASDKERETAAAKLNTKREQLVRNARLLVEEGIEYKNADLPRSLRPEDALAEVALQEPVAEAPKAVADAPAKASYIGTSLDYRTQIMDYLRDRRRTQAVPDAIQA